MSALDTRSGSRSRAGSATELRARGQLLTKIGHLPVVVFWDGTDAFAVEDRCPHMGFPLHRGTVDDGLVTCHWHHARFDLASGCTLDLWADDATAFDVEIVDDDVYVARRHRDDERARLDQRLREGLEDGVTLVIAKAVLGLIDAGSTPEEIVRSGVDFGTTYRREGWGAGLTVLVAMANVLPHLHPDDRPIALIHGLRFVANDTAGHAPRFPVTPLLSSDVPLARLADWYRRFIDTRASDAAERVLHTAIRAADDLRDTERLMTRAITDHVLIDEGHTLDFTNKAFELLEVLGADDAETILPTVVRQTAGAHRSEEDSEWQHPFDLVTLAERAVSELPEALATGRAARGTYDDGAKLAWRFLDDDPDAVVGALLDAVRSGAGEAQVGRAVALAAALRVTRFHTQNDHADWNAVHHAFTTANALHHSLERAPSVDTMRGAVQNVLRVYLDRFLNIPPARLPNADGGTLEELAECFELQGQVDRAGNLAYGFSSAGGARDELIASLGHALLGEDAQFHWYQLYEASVRQACTWPEGSEESALILAGFARFLAAHTPTRREVATVNRIASRLRRGEALYESDESDETEERT